MSATVLFDACKKGVRYRSEQQARKARDRQRARALALGCPAWLLPFSWFRHDACGGWHLTRDPTEYRPHHRIEAA
jgi:hypothetical protein